MSTPCCIFSLNRLSFQRRHRSFRRHVKTCRSHYRLDSPCCSAPPTPPCRLTPPRRRPPHSQTMLSSSSLAVVIRNHSGTHVYHGIFCSANFAALRYISFFGRAASMGDGIEWYKQEIRDKLNATTVCVIPFPHVSHSLLHNQAISGERRVLVLQTSSTTMWTLCVVSSFGSLLTDGPHS